jgi:hypothetical protein
VRCLHQRLCFQFISLGVIGVESLCTVGIIPLTSRFARRIVTLGRMSGSSLSVPVSAHLAANSIAENTRAGSEAPQALHLPGIPFSLLR